MDNLLLIATPSDQTSQPAGAEIPASTFREDPQSMTQADDPKSNPTRGGGATGTAEKTTVFARMDGDNVDSQEYAALLDLYDNIFRNIA